MKQTLLAAVAALLFAGHVPAADAPPAKGGKESKESKEAKEPKDAKDALDAYAAESLKALEKVTDILAGVKDKKSADAARTKLPEATRNLGELKKKLEAAQPTREQRAELEKQYKSKFEPVIKRFREEAVRVETSVEGGKDLLADLDKLLKPLVSKKG